MSKFLQYLAFLREKEDPQLAREIVHKCDEVPGTASRVDFERTADVRMDKFQNMRSTMGSRFGHFGSCLFAEMATAATMQRRET